MFDSEPFRASCVSRVSAGFSFTLTDGQKNSEEWNKRTWPDFAINKSSRKWNFIFFRKCCCQRRYVLPAYETNCSESLNHLWFVFSILCRLILFWFDFLFLSFHFLCVKAGRINRLPPVSCSKPTSLSTSSNVWYLFYLWYLLSALFQGLMWCVSSLSRLF